VGLRLRRGQLEVHDKIGRVARGRERAAPVGCFVERAHVVGPLLDLGGALRPQPERGQLSEEHL